MDAHRKTEAESHRHSMYEFGYPPNEEGSASSSTAAPYNSFRQAEAQQHSIYAYGYPSIEVTSAGAYANMVSRSSSYSYSRFGNDLPKQGIGWDQGDFSPKGNRPYMIRWKSGKKVDQRLLMLLESFFQEIYVKRQDFFKKIFPELYNEFADILDKVGAMLWKNNQAKHRTMQRSLSFGSPRTSNQSAEISEPWLERFKVRPPNIIVTKPDNDEISGPINPTAASSDSK